MIGNREKAALPALLLAAASALFPGFAAAQSLEELQIEQGRLGDLSNSGWDAEVGAALALRPVYDGAKRERLRLAPLGMVSCDHGLFFASPEGIGATAFYWGGLRIGPELGFLAGRKQDVAEVLHGMGDIPASLTAGLFADYKLGHLRLGTTVRQAVIHEANGLYGNATAKWEQRVNERVNLDVGGLMGFANGTYDRTFFGVSQQQSQQSVLPVYTPHAGLKDVGINTDVDYHFARHFLVKGFAGVNWLVSDDGASPVVRRTAQPFLGVGLEYHFGQTPVEAEPPPPSNTDKSQSNYHWRWEED